MSTAHCTARLADVPADSIRKQFVAEVRQRFRPIRGRVRHFAGYETDGFGLRSSGQQARLADGDDIPDSWPDAPTGVYEFQTAGAKADAFVRWLEGALRDDVLEELPTGRIRRVRDAPDSALGRLLRNWNHWSATYLRGAYRQAWNAAGGRLRSEGVDVGPTDLPDDAPLVGAFDVGVSRDTLRRAYIRTYENLESIASDAAADRVRETITEGIAEGVNPRVMARRLTRDIRALQRTRAETLARTEVASVSADSTLDRFEAMGVDAVSHGEWLAADDGRTCPLCNSLDGNEYTIDEMRTGSFTYNPSGGEPPSLAGEYALKPPTHPNCRCTVIPVV